MVNVGKYTVRPIDAMGVPETRPDDPGKFSCPPYCASRHEP